MPIDPKREFKPIRIAVLTVSGRRSRSEDASGDILVERISRAGHLLGDRAIIEDEVGALTKKLREWIADPEIDCVIATGGTGLTARDVTPEAFAQVCDLDIPGFGELFRQLSYQSVGTSMLQSRACAGVANGTYLFALPSSPTAVKDGWDGILSSQLDSRHWPCNFVNLIPRLRRASSSR